VAKSAQSPLSRVVLRPETASPSVVLGFALAPSVLAGLLLFRLAAVEILAVALLVGVLVHLAALGLKQPMQDSPALAAVIGVAMVGAGTPLPWVILIAVAAAVLELIRVRFAPNARLQMGLLVYVGVLLVAGGVSTAYVNPVSGAPLAEPIRLWHDFYGGAQTPIDPIRLYVGNVPGPVFATSLLAVALGAAWLWYARRLSALVVATFAIGAVAPVLYFRWSIPYQLTSGPLWFAAALVLADRKYLPNSVIGRPLIGLCAGLLAVAARSRGLAIESAIEAVVAVQVAVTLIEAVVRVMTRPRRVALPAHVSTALRPTRPSRPAGPPLAQTRPPSKRTRTRLRAS
jgi:NQR2, RnfD, RnfE family